MHEPQDDGQLLLVTSGILAKALTQVEVETLAQAGHRPVVDTAP
jgi:hypothetical protein